MGKIVRNGIDYSTTSSNANNINYDNTLSGLTAVTAQEAIDELTESLGEILKTPYVSRANANDYVDIDITTTNKSIGYDGMIVIGYSYAGVGACKVYINDILVFVHATNGNGQYASQVCIPIPVTATDMIRYESDKPTKSILYKYK